MNNDVTKKVPNTDFEKYSSIGRRTWDDVGKEKNTIRWCHHVFQVEESELDRLHSEQQTQGDNKYSTIQKVTMIDLLLARSGFGVGGGGGGHAGSSG